MLHLQTKAPGRRAGQPARRPRGVASTRCSAQRQEAYQRLLEDAMEGDARRFGRADALDEQWRIFEPVLAAPAAGGAVPPGHLGPARGRGPRRRRRRLARAARSASAHA